MLRYQRNIRNNSGELPITFVSKGIHDQLHGNSCEKNNGDNKLPNSQNTTVGKVTSWKIRYCWKKLVILRQF